jgi:hypothetical protein
MRNLVQPPPSMHCERCDGELRFKRIEPDDPVFDTEVEIFVCSKCGHVHSLPVIHDPYAAHTVPRPQAGGSDDAERLGRAVLKAGRSASKP